MSKSIAAGTVLMALLTLCAVCVLAQEPRFAIYRVDWTAASKLASSPADTAGASQFNIAVTQERLLANAVRREPPIITEADITMYCWRTQRIKLTSEGASRWNATSGWDTPLHGLPLLVVVDGEARYGALLWNPLSSFGCELPQFWCMSPDNKLIVGGRRISAAGDTIYGACYDAKAKAVLGALGKLVDNCDENW